MNKHFIKYAQFLKKQLQLEKPLRVVVDGSNGTGAALFKKAVAGKKKLTVFYINDKPDGNFPGHGPDPSSPEATFQLEKEVKKRKADLGVIFDNDADRAVFVDNTGRRLSGTEALIFLGEHFEGPVVVNSLIGPMAYHYFKKLGRRVITTKVGFYFIREAMAKHNASVGGEYSGHYFFKTIFNADCAVFSAIMAINKISLMKESLSDWLRRLPQYHQQVINFPWPRERFLELKTTFKNTFAEEAEKISCLDGIKVEFADRWFSLRPSNNEDLIRLTVEAEAKTLLKKEIERLRRYIS